MQRQRAEDPTWHQTDTEVPPSNTSTTETIDDGDGKQGEMEQFRGEPLSAPLENSLNKQLIATSDSGSTPRTSNNEETVEEEIVDVKRLSSLWEHKITVQRSSSVKGEMKMEKRNAKENHTKTDGRNQSRTETGNVQMEKGNAEKVKEK